MKRCSQWEFRSATLLCLSHSRRSFSDYSDGSDGVEWKQRYLQERRDTALEFLGDVKKRVPIHDAIRQRAQINRAAVRDIHCPSLFEGMGESERPDEDDEDCGELINNLLDDILLDENAIDRLQHVSFSDLPLLNNEIFGDNNTDEETLRKWLKLKRDTADFQSYASIPENERTAWSAWYLRHVKAAADNATDTKVTIALSSTTSTGLLIGVALISVLMFGLNMMQGINISDTITDAATESN